MTTKAADAERVKRPKRAPIGEKRRTFTFRLSDDVRERVEASAAAAGRSMSEELEWRVQRSLNEEERLLERFVSTDNLNVFAAIASSWKAISIFSGKEWSEDIDTLDLCKKSAFNIVSWMKSYKLIQKDKTDSDDKRPEASFKPSGVSALAALGAGYFGAEQKSLKQDRLSWEAARWALGLSTSKPDMDSRLEALMDAAKIYSDDDARLNLHGQTKEEAERRYGLLDMQPDHSKEQSFDDKSA